MENETGIHFRLLCFDEQAVEAERRDLSIQYQYVNRMFQLIYSFQQRFTLKVNAQCGIVSSDFDSIFVTMPFDPYGFDCGWARHSCCTLGRGSRSGNCKPTLLHSFRATTNAYTPKYIASISPRRTLRRVRPSGMAASANPAQTPDVYFFLM